MKEGPLQLLVLQPTNFCNIDCTYCYLSGRSDPDRMAPTTVERLCVELKRAGLVPEPFRIVFHAGEPLVAPPDYYCEIIDKFQTHFPPEQISFGVQTNGTLIDEKWCTFFRDNDIKVSLSIDGPEEINDKHRVDRRGQGTHSRVMEGVRHLRHFGIPFAALCVVKASSVKNAKDLFEFFDLLGPTSVGFSIDERVGDCCSSTFEQIHKDEELLNLFRNFFLEYFEYSRKRDSKVLVREMKIAANRSFSPEPRITNNENEPFQIISVAKNGDFSTFSPELLGWKAGNYQSFTFGNVNEQDAFLKTRDRTNFQVVLNAIREGRGKCQETCKYFGVCGGGSPAVKFGEWGAFETSQTIACRFRVKALFEAFAEHVNRCVEADDR